MKCATHPDIETSLTCSKCGKPICPKCLVETPVGARCRECAQLNRLPTFSVSSRTYLKALGAGLGMAVVCGAAWWFARNFLPIPYLNLVMALAAGWAIGEVISRVVNHKRSKGLAALGGLMVVLSYPLSFVLPGRFGFGFFFFHFNYFDLVGVIIGVVIAVNRLR